MNLNYKIKKLTEEDLHSLKGFFETLSNLTIATPLSIEKSKEVLSKINSQDSHLYIAQKDTGEIIGTITLLIEQKFIHNAGKVAHIEDVAVRKGYERMGIGSSLIKKAIKLAKEHGFYKVILDCSDANIPFYQKLGFYKHENAMRLDL